MAGRLSDLSEPTPPVTAAVSDCHTTPDVTSYRPIHRWCDADFIERIPMRFTFCKIHCDNKLERFCKNERTSFRLVWNILHYVCPYEFCSVRILSAMLHDLGLTVAASLWSVPPTYVFVQVLSRRQHSPVRPEARFRVVPVSVELGATPNHIRCVRPRPTRLITPASRSVPFGVTQTQQNKCFDLH